MIRSKIILWAIAALFFALMTYLIYGLITKGKQYPNNIIQRIEVHKDSCYYKVNQYWKRDGSLCCSVYVLEPCGLYNDGYTLKIK